MANIRTLKLNLLGDVSQFSKSMKKASGETQSFSSSLKSNMKSLAKSAALAGVAAAGMAVAFGVDAVKAAIADQKSQALLANQLKKTTKATKTQIKAVENWITTQQYSKGFTDDQLRPALAKLARVTGSVEKSQNLLTLAMDVSAGAGVSLETATNAITKAQLGQFKGLKSLGVPLTDTIIKTKNLGAALDLTGQKFSGAALTNAKTFEGRLKILGIRFNEFKENVGYKLLPYLAKFLDIIEKRAIPLLANVADGFNGKNGVNHGVKSLGEALAAKNIGKAIKELVSAVAGLFGSFTNPKNLKGQKTLAENLQAIADSIQSITDTIKALKPLIDVLVKLNKYTPNILTVLNAVSKLRNNLGMNPTQTIEPPTIAPNGGTTGGTGGRRMGFMARQSPTNVAGTTIINLNGIVDGESARRTIERVLQKSSIQSGPINLNGSVI